MRISVLKRIQQLTTLLDRPDLKRKRQIEAEEATSAPPAKKLCGEANTDGGVAPPVPATTSSDNTSVVTTSSKLCALSFKTYSR